MNGCIFFESIWQRILETNPFINRTGRRKFDWFYREKIFTEHSMVKKRKCSGIVISADYSEFFNTGVVHMTVTQDDMMSSSVISCTSTPEEYTQMPLKINLKHINIILLNMTP